MTCPPGQWIEVLEIGFISVISLLHLCVTETPSALHLVNGRFCKTGTVSCHVIDAVCGSKKLSINDEYKLLEIKTGVV